MSKLTIVDETESELIEKSQDSARFGDKPARQRRAKNRVVSGLIAIFFVAFVVAGLTTARWGIIRLFNPTPYTVEDEIKEGIPAVLNAAPTDAWDAWLHYQSVGLGKKEPAPYYRIRYAMELQDSNMIIGGIITSMAFGGMLLMLFWPKGSR